MGALVGGRGEGGKGVGAFVGGVTGADVGSETGEGVGGGAIGAAVPVGGAGVGGSETGGGVNGGAIGAAVPVGGAGVGGGLIVGTATDMLASMPPSVRPQNKVSSSDLNVLFSLSSTELQARRRLSSKGINRVMLRVMLLLLSLLRGCDTKSEVGGNSIALASQKIAGNVRQAVKRTYRTKH